MSSTSKNPIRGLSILIIDLILFFTLLNILPFNPQENKGLALLAFIGILWLTEAFHITITALLVPVFAIGLGVLNTKSAFAPFSEPIIFMFFGGFVIAAVLNIQKIDLWIANHVIRLARGSLKLTVFYLFAVTNLLSFFINNTAVAALMLPLTLGILHKVDMKTNRNLYVFVLLGIAFSASIGGIATLVGSAPNAIMASQIKVSFSEWLAYGVPVTFLLLIAMMITLLIVLRPNFNVPFDVEIEEIPMTGKRIVTLIVFTLTAIFLIFSSVLEPVVRETLGLTSAIRSFDALIAMIAVMAFALSGTATWNQIQERTEWGVLLLCGGGMVLSIVLKDTGASKILAETIVSYIGDKNWWLMAIAMTAFILFLTEFTSNTASAALLMPIYISVATSLGLPPISLAAIIACGASCAFMLPIATPPNAIVFATGYIKQKDMLRVGIILNTIGVIIIGSLSYFFWMTWW